LHKAAQEKQKEQQKQQYTLKILQSHRTGDTPNQQLNIAA